CLPRHQVDGLPADRGLAALGASHGRDRRLAGWLRVLARPAVVADFGGWFLSGRGAGVKGWLELLAERVVAGSGFEAARMVVAQASVFARAVPAVAGGFPAQRRGVVQRREDGGGLVLVQGERRVR